jgi:DNA invertase Pin-like site-specific DNA recombinase
MVIGYSRCSTKSQNLDHQNLALKNAGCTKIFAEKVSGMKTERTELKKLLESLRSEDTLIVYSLDRLGRTTHQLIELLDEFKAKGVHFKSLTEGLFDTTSAMGRAVLEIMAVLKAMEVSILRERTKSGLAAARARGRIGGRPKGSFNKLKASAAANLYAKGETVAEITTTLGISSSTLYQYLRREGVTLAGATATGGL